MYSPFKKIKRPWVRNFPYGGSGTAKGKINIVNPREDYYNIMPMAVICQSKITYLATLFLLDCS